MNNQFKLRTVTGFDPAAEVVEVKFYDQEGKPGNPRYLLQTKPRLAWFHQFCAENGVMGVVDDSDLTYDPQARALFAKATVFMDGEVVGRSTFGVYFPENVAAVDPYIGATVATAAKGRALANAGFSTEMCVPTPTADLPISPKKSGLRLCQSYNPDRDVIVLGADNGKERVYLPVAYRVRWFQHYLHENHLSGYLDDSEVRYDPEGKLFVATAKVYMNGALVAQGSASAWFDPERPTSAEFPVPRICTEAKGRALENAGFNILAYDIGETETPCDSGVNIIPAVDGTGLLQNLYQVAAGQNTVPKLAPQPTEPAPKKRGRKPAAKKPAEPPMADNKPVPEAEPAPSADAEQGAGAMSKEEALSFVIPVGDFKGLTIAEVLASDPVKGKRALSFYGGTRFINPKYNALKMAAKVVMEGM